MELTDFLTLIQLAAGLNIAFVAVEVAQGYTRILSDKVFNITQLLDNAFQELKSTISVNRTTLDNTHSTDVDGKSTTNKIEEIKREYEKLEKKIEQITDDITANSNLKCNFRCFSGLSLMIFFFCCTLIFLAPFNAISLAFLMTLLTLIYSIGGWFLYESRLFCSLKVVIWEFTGGMIVCIILWLCIRNWDVFKTFMQSANDLTIITASLLPFVNFIAFFLKVIRRVQDIRQQISQHRTSLITEIEPINEKFNKLRSLELLKMEMTD